VSHDLVTLFAARPQCTLTPHARAWTNEGAVPCD
jgi:hypothetical protein